jgi:hypothetical protein
MRCRKQGTRHHPLLCQQSRPEAWLPGNGEVRSPRHNGPSSVGVAVEARATAATASTKVVGAQERVGEATGGTAVGTVDASFPRCLTDDQKERAEQERMGGDRPWSRTAPAPGSRRPAAPWPAFFGVVMKTRFALFLLAIGSCFPCWCLACHRRPSPRFAFAFDLGGGRTVHVWSTRLGPAHWLDDDP